MNIIEQRCENTVMKEALLSRAEVAGTLSAKGTATKVSKVGRGLTY